MSNTNSSLYNVFASQNGYIILEATQQPDPNKYEVFLDRGDCFNRLEQNLKQYHDNYKSLSYFKVLGKEFELDKIANGYIVVENPTTMVSQHTYVASIHDAVKHVAECTCKKSKHDDGSVRTIDDYAPRFY